MTNNIIKMPKRLKIEAPFASTVAIPVLQSAGIEPTIETTFTELLAIKKFLQFQLDDIFYQLNKMSKTKHLRPHEFKKAKHTAELLAAYLINTLTEIDSRMANEPTIGSA